MIMNSHNEKPNFRTKMACLSVNDKQYFLYEGINTIGRCLTATVPLKHLDISKQHAIITIVNENQHYVSDFQSFNGTSLNRIKLQPLLLYELTQDNTIQLANINAIYKKVPTDVQNDHCYNNHTIENIQNTQNVTQSFYNASTQAFEHEITPVSMANIENPQNYFDDDYNFEDVSTQLPPVQNKTTHVIPKSPLIHDMPTQIFCNNDHNLHEKVNHIHDLPTQSIDIHEAETQGIALNPSVHDLPTQLITNETSIIDETIFNESDVVTAHGSASKCCSKPSSQNSDSQSNLHVGLLNRHSKRILDDPEDDTSSKLGVNTKSNDDVQSSEDEIKCKPKKKLNIIQSDSETDMDDGDVTANLNATKIDNSDSETDIDDLEIENPKSVSSRAVEPLEQSDTSEKCAAAKSGDHSDSETDVEDLAIENCVLTAEPLKQSDVSEKNAGQNSAVTKPIDDSLADTDSDADSDYFQFKTQAEDDDDDIIPATQFSDGEENLKSTEHSHHKLDNDKLTDSIDMDSLYLEPTQAMEIEGSKDIFVLPAPPTRHEEVTVTTTDDDDDVVFMQPTQMISTTVMTVKPQLHDDEIFMQPTQLIPAVTPDISLAQTSTIPDDDDIIFMQPTQIIGTTVTTVKSQLHDDEIFMQPTQLIPAVTPDNSSAHTSTFPDDDDDVIFMQPTQLIPAMAPQDNPASHTSTIPDDDDIIVMQPIQPTSSTNDVNFLQPSVPLKKATSNTQDDRIFEQPTQIIPESEEIFNQETQKLETKESVVEKRDVEEELAEMFASQQANPIPNKEEAPEVESQLEVIFPSQNVTPIVDASRPSNPLLNEWENKTPIEEGKNLDKPTVSNEEHSELKQEASLSVTVKPQLNARASSSATETNSNQALKGSDMPLPSRMTRKTSRTQIKTSTPRARRSTLDVSKDAPKDENSGSDDEAYYKAKSLKGPNKALPSRVTRKTARINTPTPRATRSALNVLKKPPQDKDSDTDDYNDYQKTPTLPLHQLPPIKTDQSESAVPSKASRLRTRQSSANAKMHSDTDDDTDYHTNPTLPLDELVTTVNVEAHSVKQLKSSVSVLKRKSDEDLDDNKDYHSRPTLPMDELIPLESEAKNDDDEHTSKPLRATRGRGSKTLVEAAKSKSSTVQKRKMNSTSERSTTSKKDLDKNALTSTSATFPKRPKRTVKPPKKFATDDDASVSESVNTSSSKTDEEELVKRGNKKPRKLDAFIETSDSEHVPVPVIKKALTRTVKGRKLVVQQSHNFEEEPSTSKGTSTRSKRILTSKSESTLESPQKKQKAKESDLDSDDFVLKTPKGGKKIDLSPCLSTPERNKRKLKPKVVFTMMESPELEGVIRRLGGMIVDSVETCTVIVTGSLKRSQKLLAAVGQGKPVCSPTWIRECKRAHQFLDPWDYILEDKEAEGKWKLSLRESLNRSRNEKLLSGYVVYITVTTAVDVLKAAVESSGGKCVMKPPGKVTENFIVVANAENKSKYTKFLKHKPPVKVVLPEAIFDGVLRQELRLDDHLIS